MIWGYGSDKFLVNGLGSIFISLLMLEQMHTLLAVPSQKDRENRYIAMGVAVIGITVFMQFFWINVFCVVEYSGTMGYVKYIWNYWRKSKRVCGS